MSLPSQQCGMDETVGEGFVRDHPGGPTMAARTDPPSLHSPNPPARSHPCRDGHRGQGRVLAAATADLMRGATSSPRMRPTVAAVHNRVTADGIDVGGSGGGSVGSGQRQRSCGRGDVCERGYRAVGAEAHLVGLPLPGLPFSPTPRHPASPLGEDAPTSLSYGEAKVVVVMWWESDFTHQHHPFSQRLLSFHRPQVTLSHAPPTTIHGTHWRPSTTSTTHSRPNHWSDVGKGGNDGADIWCALQNALPLPNATSSLPLGGSNEGGNAWRSSERYRVPPCDAILSLLYSPTTSNLVENHFANILDAGMKSCVNLRHF
ncbi:hypothetical protein BDN70DRAFT_979681 [Pholiota conissans]|uniref:Uncharacterized protein n=1 Tax=Pholiota conissans TaxID=109636 RepID=A0A9P5YJE0_9AGAR|nr:hypothetical protein BDN70DRAFT_979681 [Pholiota conissans]